MIWFYKLDVGKQMYMQVFILMVLKRWLIAILKIEDCDILICIFWKRLGTPTKKDGKTGTEHEFHLAYEAFKKKKSHTSCPILVRNSITLKQMKKLNRYHILINLKEKSRKWVSAKIL